MIDKVGITAPGANVDTAEDAASRLETALERIAAHLANAALRPPTAAVAVPAELSVRLDRLIDRLRAEIGTGG